MNIYTCQNAALSLGIMVNSDITLRYLIAEECVTSVISLRHIDDTIISPFKKCETLEPSSVLCCSYTLEHRSALLGWYIRTQVSVVTALGP